MSTNPSYPTERGTRAADTQPYSGSTYDSSTASGPAPNTAGPHTHDTMNMLDPTTDSSTRDRQPTAATQQQPLVGDYTGGAPSQGAYPTTGTEGHAHHHGTTTGEGQGARHGHGGVGATAGGGGTGSVGEQQRLHKQHEKEHGHLQGEAAHKSEFLNKLDPRVDSKTGTWKSGSGTGGV